MREQQAEPSCQAAISYIVLGRPPAVPPNFLLCFPPHDRPSFSEVQELAGNGRLYTTEEGIALLVRKPASPPCLIRRARWGETACWTTRPFASTYIPISDAPSGYAGLPLDGFLPRRHHAQYLYQVLGFCFNSPPAPTSSYHLKNNERWCGA